MSDSGSLQPLFGRGVVYASAERLKREGLVSLKETGPLIARVCSAWNINPTGCCPGRWRLSWARCWVDGVCSHLPQL